MVRRVETAEYATFVRRITRAYSRRVGEGQDIGSLGELVRLRADVDAAITAAAIALHAGDENTPGHSWGEIGRELGITRQSARERFDRHSA